MFISNVERKRAYLDAEVIRRSGKVLAIDDSFKVIFACSIHTCNINDAKITRLSST